MFNPRRDILVGDFVLVRPDNMDEHVWLARALTTLDRKKKTYALDGKFIVQWWMPIGKSRASKKSLLDKPMDKVCCSLHTYTLWKCGLHEARQEARPNNSLHITKIESTIMAMDTANTSNMEAM